MPRVLFGVTVAMTAQAFLRDQMAELASRGWDVHLACSPEDGTDAFDHLGGIPGVTLHRLAMARPPRPVKDARSLLAWLRLVREVRPHVVVASTPKAGLLGTVAARLLGVPSRIYHVRGLRSEGLRGPMAALSRASERAATASATEVLVDSWSLLAAMHRESLLADNKGVVLGQGSCCGVDTAWFRSPTPDERRAARQALGFAEHEVVIGFLGRLAEDKGVRELVDATQRANVVDPRIHLALVGPVEDSDALRQALAIVRFSGWASATGPTADPRSNYWAFDIFCLPSYREGFPIAPLEAQACGLPVITTDATGCVDAIEPDITGLTVRAGATDDLCHAILHLCRDEAMRARMGQAARERTVRDFDRSVVRERFLEFIEDAHHSTC